MAIFNFILTNEPRLDVFKAKNLPKILVIIISYYWSKFHFLTSSMNIRFIRLKIRVNKSTVPSKIV